MIIDSKRIKSYNSRTKIYIVRIAIDSKRMIIDSKRMQKCTKNLTPVHTIMRRSCSLFNTKNKRIVNSICMKNRIENKISMFNTVLTLCKLHIDLLQTNTGLHQVFIAFEQHYNELLPLIQSQIINRKGITKNKKALREQLILEVEEASGIIMSYASSVQNHEIYASVNFSYTKLKEMRDMVFITHANNVIDLLTTHQAALAIYGVDAAYINNIQTIYNDFDANVTSPTRASNERKTATFALEAKVKTISALLKKDVDKAMLILKRKQPEFYNTYRNARNIIDIGIRHKKSEISTLQGSIMDEATQQPINNAIIEIIDTTLVSTSNKDGKFTITTIPIGKHKLKIKANNYPTKIIENIAVKTQASNHLHINLSNTS